MPSPAAVGVGFTVIVATVLFCTFSLFRRAVSGHHRFPSLHINFYVPFQAAKRIWQQSDVDQGSDVEVARQWSTR